MLDASAILLEPSIALIRNKRHDVLTKPVPHSCPTPPPNTLLPVGPASPLPSFASHTQSRGALTELLPLPL